MRMEEAIQQLRERFSSMSNDLCIVEKRLDQEFSHVYGDKSHPRRLLYRLQHLQKNIHKLSHQSQVLFEAKSELVQVLRQQLNAYRLLSSLQAHLCSSSTTVAGPAAGHAGGTSSSSSASLSFLQDVRCEQIYQEGEELLKRWNKSRQLQTILTRYPDCISSEEPTAHDAIPHPATTLSAEGAEEKKKKNKDFKNEISINGSEHPGRTEEKSSLSSIVQGEAFQNLSSSSSVICEDLPFVERKGEKERLESSVLQDSSCFSSSSSSSSASSSPHLISRDRSCTERVEREKKEEEASQKKKEDEQDEKAREFTNCRCGFVPISSSVFTQVPVLTRRRAKLEDVNHLYHFLFHSTWEKARGSTSGGTRGKPSSSSSSVFTTTIKELNRLNFTVVGQTGEAKLSTLRYLGLLEIHPKQGILRLVVQNQKGKRKGGENDGERFRHNPGGGVCTPQTGHHPSHSPYNSFQHTNIPREFSTKKQNTFHSSSTPSSSLKRQKFTPHN